MIDPFDLNTAPLGEPLGLVRDGSVQWRREIEIDPDLFNLRYTLRRFNPDDTVDGETLGQFSMGYVSGIVWAVDLLPGDSTAWATGDFFWDLEVIRSSDSRSKVIDIGRIMVFGSQDDRRSHAQLMVSKIEGLLQGRADSDVESYSIKSRSITKMSMAELTQWRDYYLREVQSEQAMSETIFSGTSVNKTRARFRMVW
jgi:hypothetical protein